MAHPRPDSRSDLAFTPMNGEGSSSKSPSANGLDELSPELQAWVRRNNVETASTLDGEIAGCACPNCGAPMSVRWWLSVADCWRCGTSIELTIEQEQALQRQMQSQSPVETPAALVPSPAPAPLKNAPLKSAPQKQPAAAPPVAPIPKAPLVAKLLPPVIAKELVVAPPVLPPPVRVPLRRIPPVRQSLATVVRLPQRAASETWRILWHEILTKMPFWLVSAAVHSVLFLVLAICLSEKVQRILPPGIRLSEYEDADHIGEGMNFDHDSPTHIDLFEASKVPTRSKEEIQNSEDAAKLTRSTDGVRSNRPPLKQVVSAVNAVESERMFQGRDPRLRHQIISAEGGTTQTEASVARGLRWLALHQHDDGHWGLHDFHRTGDCNGRCKGHGQESDTGGTALALLPFLGAGQTQNEGIYKEEVAKGLKWLLSAQGTDGDLRGRGIGRMYAHAQATIVLCEAYAITHDATLLQAAQSGVDFILKAQNPVGGWRYTPGENPGDTSVVGWQLMALRSGKMAGLNVPDQAFDKTAKFLNSVQSGAAGGLYSYQPQQRQPTPAMTAEGLLCREYLGWPRTHEGLQEGVRYLAEHLPTKKSPNIYYWYYGTQVLHHLGGDEWEKWNEAIRTTLVETQETVGHSAGSWTPAGGVNGGHDVMTGGRIYMTSLSVCTLEVYYRHLPIYRGLLVKDPTKK